MAKKFKFLVWELETRKANRLKKERETNAGWRKRNRETEWSETSLIHADIEKDLFLALGENALPLEHETATLI